MPRILFVHPDLGIGGAERLVIDTALALQNKGHSVSFLTNHYDPNHCFEETKNGLLTVETVGDWLPRSIFGKLYALCAYLRMIYAALYVVFSLSKKEEIDIIFCDQISHGIPIFKFAKNNPKVLFYCHFPDQLLSKPGSFLKQIYRYPLNFFEEKTTGSADGILVNSKFTRSIFKTTFKTLNVIPDVLYPSLNTKYFDNTIIETPENIAELIKNDLFVFLSINRYERKKNLNLALNAFKLLENSITNEEWGNAHLLIAGGYDTKVLENIEHFDELKLLCSELKIESKVTFLQSPSDIAKLWLLKRCQTLIYTPENEHFGIVPLEAMYMSKPVIAANSGGPTETIVNGKTGFLCNPLKEVFADSMKIFIKNKELSDKMGEMGRIRIITEFSFNAFSDKIDHIVTELLNKKNK